MRKSRTKKLEERIRALEYYLGIVFCEQYGGISCQSDSDYPDSRMSVVDKIVEKERKEFGKKQ